MLKINLRHRYRSGNMHGDDIHAGMSVNVHSWHVLVFTGEGIFMYSKIHKNKLKNSCLNTGSGHGRHRPVGSHTRHGFPAWTAICPVTVGGRARRRGYGITVYINIARITQVSCP